MTRYVEGWNRNQSFLLPESIDDYVGEDNPVRVVDVFVDELDLAELGFSRATLADTGCPAYQAGPGLGIEIKREALMPLTIWHRGLES